MSQAPASFCWEASRRALAMADASDMRLEAEATATGLSHAFWVPVAFPFPSKVSVPPPPEGDWWTGSLEEAGPGLCGRYLQRKPKRQRAPAW